MILIEMISSPTDFSLLLFGKLVDQSAVTICTLVKPTMTNNVDLYWGPIKPITGEAFRHFPSRKRSRWPKIRRLMLIGFFFDWRSTDPVELDGIPSQRRTINLGIVVCFNGIVLLPVGYNIHLYMFIFSPLPGPFRFSDDHRVSLGLTLHGIIARGDRVRLIDQIPGTPPLINEKGDTSSRVKW